jgi:hypothetical protein
VGDVLSGAEMKWPLWRMVGAVCQVAVHSFRKTASPYAIKAFPVKDPGPLIVFDEVEDKRDDAVEVLASDGVMDGEKSPAWSRGPKMRPCQWHLSATTRC